MDLLVELVMCLCFVMSLQCVFDCVLIPVWVRYPAACCDWDRRDARFFCFFLVFVMQVLYLFSGWLSVGLLFRVGR